MLLFLLYGCYSMETASNEALRGSNAPDCGCAPIEHVMVSNYGWYLFNCVPLVCGNASPDASFPWKFFSDQVSPAILHDRMMSYANSKKANVSNLVATHNEKVFLEVPGSDIPVPIPFLLCYQEIQLSAVLTNPPEPAGPKPANTEVSK
jgi:hypothetical protein